ncbi:hypothetical protein BD410DRAFT_846044 [Rickenella mellea]|uniref:Uncharacterized protein n=1 Tax=Rickenella mellea TaxID=50990 RepID=A0A4Y7PJ16_9AGAM|nr:hypothetical protein BD410DRAFT_846044 [Rickenella mellea]
MTGSKTIIDETPVDAIIEVGYALRDPYTVSDDLRLKIINNIIPTLEWIAQHILFPLNHVGTLTQDDKLFKDHWGSGIGNIPITLPPPERSHHWDVLEMYGCLEDRGDDITPLPDFGAFQILNKRNNSTVEENSPLVSYIPPPRLPKHLDTTIPSRSTPVIHIQIRGLDMDAPANKAKPKGLHSRAPNDTRAKSTEWTARQRELAAQAKVPANLEELERMVNEGWKDGVRTREHYVKVPAELVTQ